MPRWNRTHKLDEDQSSMLKSLCEDTKGITQYGNRARSAVMLDHDVAWVASHMSAEISFGATLNTMLRDYLSPVLGAFQLNADGAFLDSDLLLENLALSYGGFLSFEQACRSNSYQTVSRSTWVIGGISVALIADKKERISCNTNKNQLISITKGAISFDPDHLDHSGFLVLQNPISPDLHKFLTKIGTSGLII